MKALFPALALILVLATCGEDVAAAESQDQSLTVHLVNSEFQHGETELHVLRPDAMEPGRHYPVLYVLPTHPGARAAANAIRVVQRLDLHNRHGLICVAPAFDSMPWYADHPSDAKIRQESHLLKVVLPFVEQHYPVILQPQGRLLVGFSKSGWGAYSLLLRHPEVFGRAAAFDTPFMIDGIGKYSTDRIMGTQENFDRYAIPLLLADRAELLQQQPPRLVLIGHGRFEADGRQLHERMQAMKIPHHWVDGPVREHAWNSGWLAPAVELLMNDEQATPQISVATVDRMPRLPRPLEIRDWNAVARAYYPWIFDPAAQQDCFPALQLNDKPGFLIKSYVGGRLKDEAFGALGGVIGAKLAGLDPRDLNGINFVERVKAWYDPKLGIYRHELKDRQPIVHADIYGYWAAIQGMMLAAQYPDDAELQEQLRTALDAFREIAGGMGSPAAPNYDVLGWDFAKKVPDGRDEPANRLGHAPSVAWVMMVAAMLEQDQAALEHARATMQWYIDHPGRYELSHVMGPLVTARLNAQFGQSLELAPVMAAWFGEGARKRHTWRITSGTQYGGITCDGLDAAKWTGNHFYAFTMGTLQGPAWLVPVARYDQRYARAIGKYALHAANSARLLQGVGLDADHQDHAAWKARWDPQNLLFYEGLSSWDWSDARKYRPYATGDPVKLAWDTGRERVPPEEYLAQRDEWFGNGAQNLALYMGNYVGLLGGIVRSSDVPGVLIWDCLATDWFHPPAYPTRLIYNPHDRPETVEIEVGDAPVDVYDTVSKRFLVKDGTGTVRIECPPDAARVIVLAPAGGQLKRENNHLLVDGIVIDYQAH